MRIYWLCPLVEYPRATFWAPKLISLQATIGTFAVKWSTTDSNLAAKWAAGVADVSDPQLVTIKADTQIHVIESAELFQRYNQFPAAFRTRVNAFCTTAGITLPQSNEVATDIVNRITQVADNKTLNALTAELDTA